MPDFVSKWMEFSPETLRYATDKTDKTPSVSSVSPTGGGLESIITAACGCDPLPSQAKYGHLAQAGCGPMYEPCDICGFR